MNSKIKDIRSTFRMILDEKLERIIKEKEKQINMINKQSNKTQDNLIKVHLKEAKGNLDLSRDTIPFLNLMLLIKNEKYLPLPTIRKYNSIYNSILNYQCDTCNKGVKK